MDKDSMDILFVYPSSNLVSDKFRISSFHVNLGSAYIIAFLREKGYKADQFISQEPNNIKGCVKSILKKNPRIVGFTVYSSNYSSCQLIAQGMKEVKPDIIIVFGGPAATVQGEKILKKNSFVDICVRGDGEEACFELINTLKRTDFKIDKTELDKINGIDYKKTDNFFRNPPGKIFLEQRSIPGYLDKYPSPYLNGIIKKADLGIITARGCNQNCVFCNCALLSKKVIATHSTDRVVAELDYISKQLKPDGAIDIFDDAFTLFPDRAMEICNKIIENKIDIKFNCATRCDLISEGLLERMKEAGLTSLSFALESAVPRVLRAIGKVQSPYSKDDPDFYREKDFLKDLKKYIKYGKKIGIDSINTSLMIGLPSETVEEGKETINFVRSLSEYIDYYAHNTLIVCHGTPLYYNSKKFGISVNTFENGINSRTVHNYDTQEIPLAPKSTSEALNLKQRKFNIDVLSLSSCKNNKKKKDFFNKIILQDNIINKDFILWIQNNLAINGPLIQIYSDYENCIKNFKGNEEIIYKYPIPTNYIFSYYLALEDGGQKTLIPYGTNMFPEQKNVQIEVINTCSAILNNDFLYDPVKTICIDRNRNDTLELSKLLIKISENKNSINDLFNTNFYPSFSSLCMWGNGVPNCQSLDTLFVDNNDLKVCWNGESIGKVGDLYSEIKYNLKKIEEETKKRRGCKNCPKKDVCTKCVFPGFLLEKEYCNLKKANNVEEAAGILQTFDLFKNL